MQTQEQPRKMLGDLLVEYNIITKEQLQEALAEQKRSGKRLGKVLVERGYVTEQQINEILEFQLGIPQVNLFNYPLDVDLIKSIPEAQIRHLKVIPLKKSGNRLTLAMADPLNLMAIDDVAMATGLKVEPVIATELDIDAAIAKIFGDTQIEEAYKNLEATLDDEEEEKYFNLDIKMGPGDDAPIVRLVSSIFSQALKDQVSDIHIEANENNVRLRFRIDGMLRDVMNLPKQSHAAMVSRIKIMASMDIAEKRIPQDGRIQLKWGKKMYDMRVSSLPTIFGEKIVIRILDKSNVLFHLDQIGFNPDALNRYKSIIRSSYGMILVTGPTGSGKTTTLYATINELNDEEKNIITIEDPVEYVLEGINQVQVNPKAGMSFASGLRSILRQDPDMVLVGEIRDGETADIAVRAATTGHLVLSTLHTNDAAGAVTRLLDMGVEPFLVASSVVGVVAQRLVRKICPHCRTPYEPEPTSQDRVFLGIGADEPVVLFRGRGCSRCNQTGYKGRLAIHEVLTVTNTIRDLILEKSAADNIKHAAIASGMMTLRDDGMKKALEGLTTVQEVMRVAFTAD